MFQLLLSMLYIVVVKDNRYYSSLEFLMPAFLCSERCDTGFLSDLTPTAGVPIPMCVAILPTT